MASSTKPASKAGPSSSCAATQVQDSPATDVTEQRQGDRLYDEAMPVVPVFAVTLVVDASQASHKARAPTGSSPDVAFIGRRLAPDSSSCPT